MPRRDETELYEPVKRFFEACGYEVKGEVHDCDVVAHKDGSLVIAELKPAFNLTLLMQGIERQKLSESVYLVVEGIQRPGGSSWADIRHLCRRLGLGLMTVSFTGKTPRIEVLCDPAEQAPRQNKRTRIALQDEFRRRSADHNVGGSSRRRPIVTAYREEALLIAAHLNRSGTARVKELKQASGVERTSAILQKNYYGWFERVDRAIYRLTALGAEALERYADVLHHLM